MGYPVPEPHPLSQLYGSLEATAGIGTWRYSFKAKHLVWSSGIYALLGLPETAAPTYDLFAQFAHPDDRLPVDNLESYLAEVRSIDREFRLIDARGSLRCVSHKAEVFVDAQGQRIVAAGVLIDISARMNALHERYATERRLRALSQSIITINWTTEPNGDRPPSQGWMDLTGQGAKESSGLGWLDVVYEADREATKAAWLHAVQTKTRYAAKYRLKCRDGKLRWVLAHCVPIFDSVGDLEQWLGTLMDVDDLEQPVGPISEFSDLSALTGRAITAARALLNWSLFDLATQSGVSISSIRRIETLESLSVKKDVVLKLLSVLQYAGIEFRQDHGGWYVRARR